MCNSTFYSYWQAGYECADHINNAGFSWSMNDSARHASLAYDDYVLLNDFDIKTARESVGLRLVEETGDFDFSSLESRAIAAQKLGLQIIWTLRHYGWPGDVDVYPPASPTSKTSFTSSTTAFNRFNPLGSDGDDGSAPKRQRVRANIPGEEKNRYERVSLKPYAAGLRGAQRPTERFFLAIFQFKPYPLLKFKEPQ